MAPIIGICAGMREIEGLSRVVLGETYIKSVIRAGGIPVVLSPLLTDQHYADLLEKLDGILISGGPDIETRLYQGEEHPRVYGVDPRRDNLEFALVRGAAEQGVPLLGICRGMQVINVALGGTLYSHLPDQFPGVLEHDTYDKHPIEYIAHTVEVQPGSRLEKIVATGTLHTNSFHHQGLREPAPTVQPVAWSPDGLVESIELDHHPFGLGVQWHPEWMPDNPQMQAIFSAFIRAAAH